MELNELIAAIDRVEVAGRFAVSGTHAQAPLVSVDGVGTLPLPVVPLMLPVLKAAGGPAPYGRGTETVYDASVRRCTQVDADRVTVPDSFTNALRSIVDAAARGLGVTGNVSATLYKVLVYGPGDFFAPHRDTEKESGMFATLVVTLPGENHGGDLVVRHGDAVERVRWVANASGVQWAAFYADCVHEIEPLELGVRVALVYNLVRSQGAVGAPDARGDVAALTALMRDWYRTPVKLAWLLEHTYTDSELGWSALKGRDQGRAAAVLAAAEQSDVKVYLARLSIEETWAAEVDDDPWGYTRRRRRGYEDGLPRVILEEMIEGHCQLLDWVDRDGRPTDLPPLFVARDDAEVVQLAALQKLPPDEQYLTGATGNEGATVERTYRRVALVMWPAKHEIRMLVARGNAAVAAALAQAQSTAEVKALGEAAEDAGMFKVWSKATAEILGTLLRRGADDVVIRNLSTMQVEVPRVHEGVDEVLPWLPEHEGAALVRRMLENLNEWSRTSIPPLLAASRTAAETPRLWAPVLDAALPHLVQGGPLSGRPLVLVVDAAWYFDHGGMKSWVLSMLATPTTADALAAAVCELVGMGLVLPDLAARLRAWLDTVIAQPPQPPRDWARAPITGNGSPECMEVSRFLQDPVKRVGVFPLREALRRKISGLIRDQGIDAMTAELAEGSPHKLVVTKNRASYDRAMKRHTERLAWRAALAE